MQNLLSKNSNISFAKLGDENGDSATFLNLFLPDTDSTKAVVAELQTSGVGGFNYWFTNMYHFINQWDHLKNLQTVAKLPVQVLGSSQDYNNLSLPKSQEVIGRLISFGVSLKWTEEQMTELASKINACVDKVMKVNA
jgi:8-amino-3,8-dideoxy-alpha-D-manno-octulosonate transaminase